MINHLPFALPPSSLSSKIDRQYYLIGTGVADLEQKKSRQLLFHFSYSVPVTKIVITDNESMLNLTIPTVAPYDPLSRPALLAPNCR